MNTKLVRDIIGELDINDLQDNLLEALHEIDKLKHRLRKQKL